MYKYRLHKVTEDSFSFAVFDFYDNLMSVSIGKAKSVQRTAKDLGFDIKEDLKKWQSKNTSPKC